MPSEQPKDGGPAFPHGPIGMSYQGEDGYVSHQHPGSEGMALRDYFAAKAMNGIISNELIAKGIHEMKADAIAGGMSVMDYQLQIEFPAYGKASYAIADAMIVARGTREQQPNGTPPTE